MNTIHTIDTLTGLEHLPANCIPCCITSPPYWNQRDYGMEGQYGNEKSPEAYVQKMVQVFTEVYRVLEPYGTLWLNLGDAYWGSGKAGNDPAYQERHIQFGKPANKKTMGKPTNYKHAYLKPKDLIGLPWMVAFALQKTGWYLRQDIIWSKPNPMPESVTDRCTKSHEYLFLLTKSEKYYFNQHAIKQHLSAASLQRLSQNVADQKGSNRVPGKTNGPMKAAGNIIGGNKHHQHAKNDIHFSTRNHKEKGWENLSGYCNKRSVWTVPTQPFKEAHFATYPVKLITDCIKAGSRSGDIILDPFMGAGSTAIAAIELDRHFLGFELNPAYKKISDKRIYAKGMLFHPDY